MYVLYVCMYCGMPKGTCLAEVISNNEKYQASAVIKSCLFEASACRQVGMQLVSQSIEIPLNKKNCNDLLELFWVILRLSYA